MDLDRDPLNWDVKVGCWCFCSIRNSGRFLVAELEKDDKAKTWIISFPNAIFALNISPQLWCGLVGIFWRRFGNNFRWLMGGFWCGVSYTLVRRISGLIMYCFTSLISRSQLSKPRIITMLSAMGCSRVWVMVNCCKYHLYLVQMAIAFCFTTRLLPTGRSSGRSV